MIMKTEFDSLHVRKINEMIKEGERGNLLAITMEEGIAHLFAISQHKTLLKAKIDKKVTKSKGAASQAKHGKQKDKFFDSVI